MHKKLYIWTFLLCMVTSLFKQQIYLRGPDLGNNKMVNLAIPCLLILTCRLT